MAARVHIATFILANLQSLLKLTLCRVDNNNNNNNAIDNDGYDHDQAADDYHYDDGQFLYIENCSTTAREIAARICNHCYMSARYIFSLSCIKTSRQTHLYPCVYISFGQSINFIILLFWRKFFCTSLRLRVEASIGLGGNVFQYYI